MKKVLRFAIILAITAVLIPGLLACSSDSSEEENIRKWADSATEAYFEGLDANNFDKYTRYANDEFKAAITKETLETLSAQLKTQVGAYQSIEYKSFAEQEGYIHILYTVKFEKSEVSARMVFDTDHKIAGQWFD